MADYRKIAREKARKYGLNPDLFVNQIQAESGFNPRISSPAGAQGIAQIMPATARAWGVNPNNPEAALDAAARNMAKYVKKYGVEGALRAYNAGEGAVEKSKGYAETNNYVKKILGGLDLSDAAKTAPRAGRGSTSRSRTRTIPGRAPSTSTDTSAALVDSLLGRKFGSKSSLLTTAANLVRTGAYTTTDPGTPDRQVTETTRGARSSSGGSPDAKRNGSSGDVLELFHDPVGGWDNGKSIGAIGGHGKHVHTAAEPGRRAYLQKIAKEKFGLTITSTTGGKHTEGSHHYSGKAFDAAGSPEAMRAYTNWVRKKYGLK